MICSVPGGAVLGEKPSKTLDFCPIFTVLMRKKRHFYRFLRQNKRFLRRF